MDVRFYILYQLPKYPLRVFTLHIARHLHRNLGDMLRIDNGCVGHNFTFSSKGIHKYRNIFDLKFRACLKFYRNFISTSENYLC